MIFQQRNRIWDLSQRPTLKPNDSFQFNVPYILDINGKQSFYCFEYLFGHSQLHCVHLAPRARIHRIKFLFAYLFITHKLQKKI